MVEPLQKRLGSTNLAFKTISIKVRYNDFDTLTRSHTLLDYTTNLQTVVETSKRLLNDVENNKPIRLLGMGVSNLLRPTNEQLVQLTIGF
ncbi:MAG: hypothetical protein KDC92_05165 [Bacteroidetes bacterium]|nr:hypothetical protein [Bacteroidota bacterium]